MSDLDNAFVRTQLGDRDAFTDWVRSVEPPLRASLRRFARQADVEAILQEGLMRMWVLAPTLKLEGKHASLRYAATIVRNLAVREAQKSGALVPLCDADGPVHDVPGEPAPPSDPGLRRAILECLKKVPGAPAKALLARLQDRGATHDRELAARVGMQLNTFLQNVVRARVHMARCLESRGVPVEGLTR